MKLNEKHHRTLAVRLLRATDQISEIEAERIFDTIDSETQSSIIFDAINFFQDKSGVVKTLPPIKDDLLKKRVNQQISERRVLPASRMLNTAKESKQEQLPNEKEIEDGDMLVVITLRIRKADHLKLKAEAHEDGETVTQLLRRIVRRHVRKT